MHYLSKMRTKQVPTQIYHVSFPFSFPDVFTALGLFYIVAFLASFLGHESLFMSTNLRLWAASAAFIYVVRGCQLHDIPTLDISTRLLHDTLVKSEVKRTWRENPSNQFKIFATDVSHDSHITNGRFNVAIWNNPTGFNSVRRYEVFAISL